jgi:hypothetical protein
MKFLSDVLSELQEATEYLFAMPELWDTMPRSSEYVASALASANVLGHCLRSYSHFSVSNPRYVTLFPGEHQRVPCLSPVLANIENYLPLPFRRIQVSLFEPDRSRSVESFTDEFRC